MSHIRTRLPAATRVALTLGLLVALTGAAPASRAADPQAEPVHVTLQAHEFSLGRADAPVTMVEFTDYQCPFCRRFHAAIWPQLKRDYVDTGKVRFIVRDLPLAMHAAARPAAEVAHCAAAQGKFWPMHDALLAGDAKLSDDYVMKKARALGMDAEALRECAMADRYEEDIARNEHVAAALGIYGTPTFVLGRTSGRELTGVRLSGAQPYETFDALLRQLLAGGGH